MGGPKVRLFEQQRLGRGDALQDATAPALNFYVGQCSSKMQNLGLEVPAFSGVGTIRFGQKIDLKDTAKNV